MSLDWWEYYDMKGNMKALRDEIDRLRKEVEKLREEVKELKGKK